MPIDPRFLAADGCEVFTGNEILVKGCLEVEGGVHLLTGYPGSPVAGFFDALSDIKDLLNEHGIRAFQANNEALAAASINGSQMLPCRAVLCMKSVGLHVASDALALGNLAGAHPQGGAVVIIGDDPWCDSTQVPADSRFLCEHLRMPVVEPGSMQQLKDWVDLSFRLSRAAGLYIGYVVTTAQCDGGGTVSCRPNSFPAINRNSRVALDTAQIDLDKVLLPPRTWQHELDVPRRFELTLAEARRLGVNRIFAPPAPPGGVFPLGFIVTGMGGPYLQQALAEAGLAGQYPVLQAGMSYPVDIGLVRRFAAMCRIMVVVEERRAFLERNIRDALFRVLPADQAADISARLYGKKFPGGLDGIPDARGLNCSITAQRVLPLVQALDPARSTPQSDAVADELQRLNEASRANLHVVASAVVPRTPTFCPGCPHRDSAAILLELRRNLADPAYMARHHGRPPVDLVAHGDTGCYTMLMFPPTEQLMHNYSGMGLGAGTGSGIDPFITNKQIVFMGDSTFFHSGQIAITNSVKASQDITYIILENGTTAMTGHQDHAANEEDMFGNRHAVQDIEQIVRGMAATAPIKVARVNPEHRERYRRILEEFILADGVKVIIADKECGITFHRARLRREREIIRRHGYLPRKTYMNITPEVCENCLECTKQTACPGLTVIQTDYGPKIDTDLTWCVNDGACERVRVSNEAGTSVKPCPSFEEVTVIHRRRRRYLLPNMSLSKLPEAQVIHDMKRPGAVWRCHVSGVGGMGIGVVSAILVRAGHREGYRVLFQEKKGLAIRNGGTYAQITFIADATAGDAAAPPADSRPADAGSALPARGGPETPGGGYADAAEVCAFADGSGPCLTGNIPYGKADLLLGLDILEAARAVDPREQFRVASPQRTCAVLNMHKQPTVSVLLGTRDYDPEALRRLIEERCRPDQTYARDLSAICEERLSSKQFVNLMMLGVAYQLGLIPVSVHSIAWAIKDTIKREHQRNLKAFNIGRKLALEPRALMPRPQPITWEQLLTSRMRILRRSGILGNRRAQRLETLARRAVAEMPNLSDAMRYDLVLRVYDALQYQDHRLAERYIDLVRRIYVRDSAARGYQATAAAIWNIARVILIKDEPYVAYLLTREEKRQRDIVKYGVDPANGDRIIYRHYTNPELTIGPVRIRFRLRTRNWMLHIVRRCKWLRRLPGWHRREQEFRDWYIGLLPRLDLSDDGGYALALEVLRCPERVSGYREVRYPKMAAVMADIQQRLAAAERRAAAPSPAPPAEAAAV